MESSTRLWTYLGSVRDFIADTQEVRELFRDVQVDHRLRRTESECLSGSLPINTSPNVNHKTWHDVLQATTRSHEDFLAEVRKLQGVIAERDYGQMNLEQ